MFIQENVFVVVDPSDETHVALQRAIITAESRKSRPKLYIFIAVDSESVDTRAVNDNLFRDGNWFEEQIQGPLKAAGLEYQVEVSWCSEWQKSIMKSAGRFGADVILLPVHAKSNIRRLTFSESKWELLKNAFCPVVLVRPGAKPKRKTVLAAVNFQATREFQRELNTNILGHGKWLADHYGADFHVVNAYLDSLHYPDRGKLVKETGLAAEKIHVKQGYTDETISAVAKEIDADVVVIGTLGQTGLAKTRRGNTAERVISGLDVDVIVVNTEFTAGE